MKQRICKFCSFLIILVLFPAVYSYTQESLQEQYQQSYLNGIQFYRLSLWMEAAFEFRRAQEIAEGIDDLSQALYWVILSQMAYSDFGSALRDMEELERIAPDSFYTIDMVYHRARVYYNQGFYDDALLLFNRYINSTTDETRESADRRAAAFFWMGESLYLMGQFDEAEKFYAWVIGRYPESPKVEAASYRLDLIKQKKIEAELLALLQWSHEEALRISEEHQRTIRTYEHTLNLYQRRIAELTSAANTSFQSNTETQAGSSQPILIDDTQSQRTPQSSNSLIERARQLESEVQAVIMQYDSSGSFFWTGESEWNLPSGGQR